MCRVNKRAQEYQKGETLTTVELIQALAAIAGLLFVVTSMLVMGLGGSSETAETQPNNVAE